MPWISHPACTERVSYLRWTAFKIGEWLQHVGRRLEWWAVDPDDEIPF